MPDSSTPGFLAPAATPAPLEGQGLNRFLQQWVVGITGLAGNLVRPRWQAEPPVIPDAATAWCAIGVTDRVSDTYPYIEHDGDGNGSDTIQRHETMTVLASFFDTGVSGLADSFAEIFREGAMIPQNLEALLLADMGIVETGEATAVPSLLKERWLYQVDIRVMIRREIQRTYNVLNILSEQGTLVTDTLPATPPFNIGVPHP